MKEIVLKYFDQTRQMSHLGRRKIFKFTKISLRTRFVGTDIAVSCVVLCLNIVDVDGPTRIYIYHLLQFFINTIPLFASENF